MTDLSPSLSSGNAVLPRYLRVLGWASLVANVLIVGTGGAVRLTASGLGCPTWPRCTDESWVTTPEMGAHGVIEFGNRLLTFLLVAIALACYFAVRRLRTQRPDLLRLSIAVGVGIAVQAGVGGVTVLLDLHPGAVGIHYMLSATLVAIAATFLYRVIHGPALRAHPAPLLRGMLMALTLVTIVTVFMGTLTTGAGPHAGDSAVARNGLDPAVLQHLHAWPGYLMVALTIAVLIVAMRGRNRDLVASVTLLFALELVQIVVGVAQARLGLPELLVGAHMVLACVIVAALTWSLHAATPVAVSSLRSRSRTLSEVG